MGLEEIRNLDWKAVWELCANRDWTQVMVGREGRETVSYKIEYKQGDVLMGTHSLGE